MGPEIAIAARGRAHVGGSALRCAEYFALAIIIACVEACGSSGGNDSQPIAPPVTANVTFSVRPSAGSSGTATVAATSPSGQTWTCLLSDASVSGLCDGALPKGSTLSVRVTPGPNVQFTQWGGACSGSSGSCAVQLSASSTTITVTLSRQPRVSIVPVPGSTGSGAVHWSDGGSCQISDQETSGDCVRTVSVGAQLRFSATESVNAHFKSWSGACTGTVAGSCSAVAATSDLSVQPRFVRLYSLTMVGRSLLADGPPGEGNVTTSGGFSCTVTGAWPSVSVTGPCASRIEAGDSVAVIASPLAGSSFVRWGSGPCANAQPAACRFVMANDVDVSPAFVATNDGSGTSFVRLGTTVTVPYITAGDTVFFRTWSFNQSRLRLQLLAGTGNIYANLRPIVANSTGYCSVFGPISPIDPVFSWCPANQPGIGTWAIRVAARVLGSPNSIANLQFTVVGDP